ncbi:Terminal oxidase biogenesis protein CtaM, putative heme A, heme O chaperone [hydrothermal vent metagenome]|uniref:Terminal oxidase biogenesis protein CtaM, putative heme A, heme O chaperone n=1 Tax=hydrothermal vent metagenome TaxID=652676 RepID=A0A3B1E0F7_9ZZZZ
MTTHDLPTLNACLNGIATIFLLLGWHAVKNNQKGNHKKYMIAALISSALFLTSYLTYHYLTQGIVTKYQGEGFIRTIYYFILFTHIPLAGLIIPFCLISVYHAIKQNFEKHTKITKWLQPVWLYVSVTGVLIYLMLYVLPF